MRQKPEGNDHFELSILHGSIDKQQLVLRRHTNVKIKHLLGNLINKSQKYLRLLLSKYISYHSQGDSGGPLACRNEHGRWVQLGVINFGFEAADGDKCANSVFARVDYYLNFIQSFLQRT